MSVFTRKELVVENFHGIDVSDPYRWLEDDESLEVAKWVDEQNEKTKGFLNQYKGRSHVKERLTRLHNYTKYSTPKKEGAYYYLHINDGLKNQPVFCRSTSLDLKNLEVVIDPNEFDEDGTAALTDVFFNGNGSLMAFSVSLNGSDWQKIQVMNTETKEVYPEILKWCKFCTICWTPDDKGFYYDRYPDPSTISQTEESYHNRVYYHIVGTDQSSDIFVYEVPNKKEYSFDTFLSDDKNYIVLEVNNGTEPKNHIYYKKTDNDKTFIPLIDEADAYYLFLGSDASTFYFQTNADAPKGRVIAIDINNPERESWKEVIPESQDAVSMIKVINKHLVVSKMVNASSYLETYDMDGNHIKKIDLPALITITEIAGNRQSPTMLIAYNSFLYPNRIAEYDFLSDKLSIVLESDVNFDSEEYETNQIFYPSKDGTKIPMFLVHKKGLELTGDHPVLLYSYGGYGASMTPSFSPAQLLWLESGGVYAVANIRGGGEYGKEWHTSALFEKRQNAFDDFASAAEWLIENKYTTSKKLAISGASNGGLLVAVSITQRPELFGAALSLVPVTDMLRFQHFTVGRFWTSEFGNAEKNGSDFSFLYKYSPLHNVKENVTYPPTLITTADTDDRVVPLHAYKFAATLQATQSGKNQVLLRVEKNAGHGQGKPVSKIIEEEADIYTFLFKTI